MNPGPMAILMSLPNVMWLLYEDVRDDAIAYVSDSLRKLLCSRARSITVQPGTQAPNTVISPGAGPLMVELHSNMVERHHSMIVLGTMDISLGRPFKV